MTKNKNKNFLFLTSITLISFLVIIFMMYLSQYCCFWGDDSWYTVYRPEENYFDCLFGPARFEHGGYYIGIFLCKFFSFGLPILLSIHPADFITYWHGLIRGVFAVITLLLISKFSVFKTDFKSVYIVFFFFSACYFFCSGLQCNVIIINYNFYRYFFSFIFFSIFWYYIYKNILPESKQAVENHKTLKVVFVTICGFILGTSIEISFYTSIFLAFLLIFYNIILNLIFFITKKQNTLFQKYNLGIKFYIPVIGLLTGLILFVTNPGAIDVAKSRGMANIYVDPVILKEYSQLYIQKCFSEHLIYWIIFILLLCISFYFAYKKQEIKCVIFPLLMQLSVLTVMFSLILCGKTFDNDYFLMHNNVIFLYKILILYPLFLYLDYVIKVNIFKTNRLLILIITIVISFIMLLNNLSNIDIIYNTKKQREMNYITEKIYRFYVLRKEKPILPDFYDLEENIYPWRRIYKEVNPYAKIVNNPYVNDYIYRIYKNKEEHEYEIRTDAMDIFYSKGGIFTDEEMKNIKFSRLFDKKFVLNEK